MANTLSRFGQYCRDLRSSRRVTMGDQAEALSCPIHVISSIETGNTPLPSGYLNSLKEWLQLNDREHADLLKRAPGIVVDFRPRNSTSNRSTNMRLFRKVSRMPPGQIRDFGKKLLVEAKDDR
jgi:hypothetical protein